MKKAIYAGTFDPFTNGHLNILQQASNLFDTIYVVFAVNSSKNRDYDLHKMMRATVSTIKNNGIKNCLVTSTSGLISDCTLSDNVEYLIRGLRNPNDYNYEENIAKINKKLNPSLNTIYLRTDEEIISSSMVKELYKYGKDVSKYVSSDIYKAMEGEN